MRIPRIPRKPWSAALALAAATALGSGGLALATAGPAAAAGSAFPAHYAAPYLQIDSSDAGDMAADEAATGLKYYTLAFLIPQSGCTPEWEDGGYGVGAFASQISAIQAAGGNVIISFGGEAGGELAQTCTNVSQLTAAYQNVVNTYGVTRLDFDIEGGVLSDTAATSRRDQALAALQAQDPAVQVDFTLGGRPAGAAHRQRLGVRAAPGRQGQGREGLDRQHHDDGLRRRVQRPRGRRVRRAGRPRASSRACTGSPPRPPTAMMGLTPIAGTNDDGTDFSTSNAQSLESFAAANGVAGAVLLGGRRLRQGDRLPVLVDLQQDHRRRGRQRRRRPGHRADHRLPGPVPG